jgi:hypothetical protein
MLFMAPTVVIAEIPSPPRIGTFRTRGDGSERSRVRFESAVYYLATGILDIGLGALGHW